VISENSIGDAGAGDLAYALCYNKTIVALDISYNCIGDAGILELLSCLQYNQVLRSMYTLYVDGFFCSCDWLCHQLCSSRRTVRTPTHPTPRPFARPLYPRCFRQLQRQRR
jgi:hypothetical protein